jgi:hypothetical protein
VEWGFGTSARCTSKWLHYWWLCEFVVYAILSPIFVNLFTNCLRANSGRASHRNFLFKIGNIYKTIITYFKKIKRSKVVFAPIFQLLSLFIPDSMASHSTLEDILRSSTKRIVRFILEFVHYECAHILFSLLWMSLHKKDTSKWPHPMASSNIFGNFCNIVRSGSWVINSSSIEERNTSWHGWQWWTDTSDKKQI